MGLICFHLGYLREQNEMTKLAERIRSRHILKQNYTVRWRRHTLCRWYYRSTSAPLAFIQRTVPLKKAIHKAFRQLIVKEFIVSRLTYFTKHLLKLYLFTPSYILCLEHIIKAHLNSMSQMKKLHILFCIF